MRKSIGPAGWQKLLALCCVLFCLLNASSQEQNLQYAINRNGKKIGDLHFQKRMTGTKTIYSLESEVKVAMLVTVSVKANEQSVYENDVLQSSSLVRHVNGHEKTNKQIRNNGKGLTVVDDGDQRELKNYVVKFSTHCLYAIEPTYYTNVFADNYQQFIPIVKLSDHHYKITFPDGNSNEYFYEKGICRKVKVRNQLFDAEFVLTSL
jgi:hypothetical protein